MQQAGLVQLHHDFQKFVDSNYYADILENNDEVGSILRLQLISERFLEVYLQERIPSDALPFFQNGKSKFPKYFNEKLTIALAYGLPTSLAQALKFLNKIRNEFGHDFDRKLSQVDIEKYVDAVDKFQYKCAVPYAEGLPLGTVVVQFNSQQLTIHSSPVAGFVIATYCLMTRAGIWLVNDLNARGVLKTSSIDTPHES